MPTTTTDSDWVPAIDGRALRRARTERGLSLRDVVRQCRAKGTPIDPGNLHRAETNQRGAIGIQKLPAVAQVLGLRAWTDVLTERGRELAGLAAAA